MSVPVTPPRRRLILLAVAAVLLAHFIVAVASKRNHGTTSDELAHLTGGFTYSQFNDYRIQPENGNLPQRWAALPVWLGGAKFPELKDNPYWRTSDAWVVGHQFFYETGEPYRPRLQAGRAMIALFSVATGLLVFAWARRLFGTAGGFVALGFFALCPNFLAHGALVTSDVCMVFFMLASVGTWWWHLHDARARIWLLSAIVFGLAFVAKFSAVLLVPMFVLIAAVRALAPAPLTLLGRTCDSRAGKFGAAALSALGQGLVAAVVIWAFYGFRYQAANPALPPAAHFILRWEEMRQLGAWAGLIDTLRTWRLLPEGFVYGFAYVLETASSRSAYLDGNYSSVGWVRFFPLAFLYKSTVALLLALPLTVIALRSLRAGGALLYRSTPLAALALVYGVFSLTSNLNIGHRHLLPIYPVLFIALGALGAWAAARRGLVAVLVGVLLAAQGWTVARAYPYYVPYFNELVGGPAQGWRHLVDSSLDWGQGLPGAKKWIDENARPGEPVFMSYFGTDEPAVYPFGERRLPFVNVFRIAQPLVPLEPGLYGISATMLAHVYSPVRGPWTLALEKEYQAARALEPVLIAYTTDPVRRAALEKEAPPERWKAVVQRYDLLRFARLCYFLRVRAPDGDIGHAFFIYRLSAEEITAATAGSLRDWQMLIERTAQSSR